MKKKLLKLLPLLSFCFFVGCQEKTQPQEVKLEKDVFAMDTYMKLTVYGEEEKGKEVLEKAEEEIIRLDDLWSTGKETSEISKINLEGKGTLSEDSGKLLEASLELGKETEGLFDISIYPIMEAWGFSDKNYRVPKEEEISNLLGLVDYKEIQYKKEEKRIQLKEGMKIDFGGIAKGYTSSNIMKLFQEEGVSGGMVNLGGNVQVTGKKPDGSPWKIAIQNPKKDGTYIGILSVSEKAIVTSGGYERFFEEGGNIYHHIVHPKSGKPVKTDLTSVTIVCKDGTLADGLSTSLFIMGKEKAEEYWRKHAKEFEVIFVTEDERIYLSEGLKEDFESDYKVEVLKK